MTKKNFILYVWLTFFIPGCQGETLHIFSCYAPFNGSIRQVLLCVLFTIWKFHMTQAVALSTRWSLRIKGKVCCLGTMWLLTITQHWRGCTLVLVWLPNIKMAIKCGCMLASLLKCPTARTAWGEGVAKTVQLFLSYPELEIPDGTRDK